MKSNPNVKLMETRAALLEALLTSTKDLGPGYGGAVLKAGGVDEASGLSASLDVLDAIVGGVMTAINSAAAELAAVKKDLTDNPGIDSSATDAEAAATAADMPEE